MTLGPLTSVESFYAVNNADDEGNACWEVHCLRDGEQVDIVAWDLDTFGEACAVMVGAEWMREHMKKEGPVHEPNPS